MVNRKKNEKWSKLLGVYLTDCAKKNSNSIQNIPITNFVLRIRAIIWNNKSIFVNSKWKLGRGTVRSAMQAMKRRGRKTTNNANIRNKIQLKSTVYFSLPLPLLHEFELILLWLKWQTHIRHNQQNGLKSQERANIGFEVNKYSAFYV